MCWNITDCGLSNRIPFNIYWSSTVSSIGCDDMRQAINYRLPIFRNMLLTQQKSNFWLEYIFAFELSSHFAFFHFVQITWSTVCMISALAYLNTNFFRQSSNFSLSSYSSYLHSNMYVLLLSLFELHLHLRDMIRDFSQKKNA